MKRSILSVLLILAMILCPLSLAETVEGVVGNPDDFTVEYIGEAAIAVTAYTGSEANLILPEVSEMTAKINNNYMNLQATTLADMAFAYNTALETVVIPEGYQYIHYQTFYGCENLTTIVLPSTLVGFDYESFANCTSLTTILFPNGANLQYVDETAFSGCTQLNLTQADIDAMMDGEFIAAVQAEAEAQAAFVVDENALVELSGYLGTDMDAFGQTFGAEDYHDSDRWGYSTDDMSVTSVISWNYIEEMALRQKCNYSLYGVYVSMDAKEARTTLLKSGWKIADQYPGTIAYTDDQENELYLDLNDSDVIERIVLILNANAVDALANGDYDSSEPQPYDGSQSLAYDDSYDESFTAEAYATGDVNMRTAPSLDAATVCTIPSGFSGMYLGESAVDDRGVTWYYINYEGMMGWCSSKFIQLF